MEHGRVENVRQFWAGKIFLWRDNWGTNGRYNTYSTKQKKTNSLLFFYSSQEIALSHLAKLEIADGIKGVKYCITILFSAKINNSYNSGETINYWTNDSIIVKPKTIIAQLLPKVIF